MPTLIKAYISGVIAENFIYLDRTARRIELNLYPLCSLETNKKSRAYS
jgi:hypothetical protein